MISPYSPSYSLLYLFKDSSIQKKLHNGKRKSLSRIFCRALRSFRSNTEGNRDVAKSGRSIALLLFKSYAYSRRTAIYRNRKRHERYREAYAGRGLSLIGTSYTWKEEAFEDERKSTKLKVAQNWNYYDENDEKWYELRETSSRCNLCN